MNNSTVPPAAWLTTDVAQRPYANDVTADVTLRTLIIGAYCVIFVLGVSGNALVVYVVVRNPAMQTITNVFITNLAASDIMMCLLAIPFTPLSGLLNSWVFGEALCHVVPMTLGVSVHVSTLTSTAIAIDRYFVIVHPFRPRIKVPVCIMLIAAIWVIAVSISLPLAVYQKMTWYSTDEVYICHEQWPPGASRKFFTIASLVLQYVLPCGVITYCYMCVSLALRARARSRARRTTRSNSCTERQQQEISRKQRTNRMLIAMTVIFVSCWLPLNVILLVLEYHPEFEKWRYFLLTFFGAHVIAMSSTVYNPFLYAWMNENFLVEFSRVLPAAAFTRLGVSRNLSLARSISQYSLMDNRLLMRRLSCGIGKDRGGHVTEKSVNHATCQVTCAPFPIEPEAKRDECLQSCV